MPKFKQFYKFFLSALFLLVTLAACSSGGGHHNSSKNNGPYPHKSASWFAKTKHTDALQNQLRWCAQNKKRFQLPACQRAKTGYIKIGGQWNQQVIEMFKTGQ